MAGVWGGGRRDGDAVRGGEEEPEQDRVGLLARVARWLRAEGSSKFKAYNVVKNTNNLAYTMLKWRVHRRILGAKLEPFLGFVHSEQHGKPSLVCDLMELYRYLMDDFVIQFSQGLMKKDFTVKGESISRKRKGKREYLNNKETTRMMKEIERYFKSKVEIPRIRYGQYQKLETLINEEALLLAKYLRDENLKWIPRIAMIPSVH